MSKSTLLRVALIIVVAWCRRAQATSPSVAECLTASERSFEFANDQRLRAERAQLLICEAASCPDDIRQECSRRADEVSRAIPTIVFELTDSKGATISPARVWMDDELLGDGLQGGAVAIDPGAHQFTFESVGRAPLRVQLVIHESEKARRELIAWPQSESVEAVARRTGELHQAGLRPQQVSAIISGTVGVVGVGVGTVFGLEALSKKHSAQQLCPASQCPTQAGVDRWSAAKSTGNVATAAFIVAGLGLAGAAVLWFADDSHKENVQVGLGPNSLQVKGAW